MVSSAYKDRKHRVFIDRDIGLHPDQESPHLPNVLREGAFIQIARIECTSREIAQWRTFG